MRAVIQENQTLLLGDAALPKAAAGQLLIRVHAAGINRADLAQAAGRYPPPSGDSNILGLEVAGVVEALGEGVAGFAVGDEVLGLVGGGAYAELCLLESALAIKKPANLSFTDAASLPEVWMTAWFNLVEIGKLAAGQRVLIHAGASGVGAASIQLAKYLGAWVATTAGGAKKTEFCRQLGADLVVDYKQQDFAALIKEAGGVDLILDGVGGDYLAKNQACLNTDGQIVLIGLLRGISTEINLGQLLMKRQRLTGSTLRAQPLNVKARLAAALRDKIAPAIAAGQLKVTVDRVFNWQEAAIAHQYIADNQNIGKVLLQVI
ncbi:NAD(P)H-quinone oxidoreductase [Iodobacter sp. HSC-16F04]|uniref:NAD(P)H-quinone oxidoreductase n=1 Tax=Iodobacter violaceini TaxID=3044271 RepID=A0ABX0KPX2_9NEIS|nr:NAD(P)H-quinone oxidoreductase [Iodobacter violacea]NHQ86500.1 NAD(P)H-quinone oxidoreductase [Iodobacter violacea]